MWTQQMLSLLLLAYMDTFESQADSSGDMGSDSDAELVELRVLLVLVLSRLLLLDGFGRQSFWFHPMVCLVVLT
jgi:hypothetical protein